MFFAIPASPPPPSMSSLSKQISVVPPLNPSKISGDPPFGFSVTTDPPFCSSRNQLIPPKIVCPPIPPQRQIMTGPLDHKIYL